MAIRAKRICSGTVGRCVTRVARASVRQSDRASRHRHRKLPAAGQRRDQLRPAGRRAPARPGARGARHRAGPRPGRLPGRAGGPDPGARPPGGQLAADRRADHGPCSPRWPNSARTWCTWPRRSWSARAGSPRPAAAGALDRGLPDRHRRVRRRVRPRPRGARRVALGAPGALAGRPHARAVQRFGAGSSRRTACRACTAGAGAWTSSGSRLRTPIRRCGPSSRRTASCWSALSAGSPPKRRSTGWPRWPGCPASAWWWSATVPSWTACANACPAPPSSARSTATTLSDGVREPRRLRAHRSARDLLPGGAGGDGLRPAGARAGRGRPA